MGRLPVLFLLFRLAVLLRPSTGRDGLQLAWPRNGSRVEIAQGTGLTLQFAEERYAPSDVLCVQLIHGEGAPLSSCSSLESGLNRVTLNSVALGHNTVCVELLDALSQLRSRTCSEFVAVDPALVHMQLEQWVAKHMVVNGVRMHTFESGRKPS